MSRAVTVDVVVFDVGGVLVELSGLRDVRRWCPGVSDAELLSRWLGCRWVRRFERGQCSVDELAAGVVADWSLPLSPQAFVTTFATWSRSCLPGAPELVRETSRLARTACLSNSNPVQWPHVRDELRLLDSVFVSHETGHVKPDACAYDHCLSELGVPGHRVLFLDDAPANVAAARAQGIVAERVDGPAAARRALQRHGILPSSPLPDGRDPEGVRR